MDKPLVDPDEDNKEMDARIAALTFTREEWAAFQANHRPPPEWFDDDDMPFDPEPGHIV